MTPDRMVQLGDRVRVVDSHELHAGVTGTVGGFAVERVIVDTDQGLQPVLLIEWWLLEVVR